MLPLQPTPEKAVENGRVVSFGRFETPFKHLNLLETDLFGLPVGREFVNRMRLKQWQHHLIIHPEFSLAFAVVNTGYMSSTFCYILDRATGEITEYHKQSHGGTSHLSRELWSENCSYPSGKYNIEIQNRLNDGLHRIQIDIAGKGGKPGIHADVELLENLEEIQPLVTLLPISENRPLYTHKAPVPVRGELALGDRRVTLDPARDTALIDVQKTYYPYNTLWRWATCAGFDESGRRIALNLVQNMIENDDTYNENVLWVDGKLSGWSGVRFTFDPKDTLKPWSIETTDGKCKLAFTPNGERAERIDLGLILSDYHQPFGTFEGEVTDDDGQTYVLKDFFGVTEYHLARF